MSPTLNAFDNNSETRATVLAPAALGVRRLTPLECERLQGLGDNHTKYGADGVVIADSNRYRMCGNAVATPVAKYVAECIEAILGDLNGR